MKKQLLISLSLVVLGGLMFGVARDAVAGHEIIGAPKCKGCHAAKTGNQWKIWTESAHARAFETLASEAAGKIAAAQGLGNPQQEGVCLACHVTRASLGADAVVSGRAKYADSEGVGCESCHGPGSDYKSQKVMKDPQAARDAGLVMDRAPEACVRCHNAQSPTFRGFDFEKRWAEIAHPVPAVEGVASTLPAAAADFPGDITIEASVGNVLFPHKLHVEEVQLKCIECHHQIQARALETPHPNYLKSSWISCQTCHNTNSEGRKKYYTCSECHHSDLNDITDETLSSKVVVHKSCWKCHESGTGVGASEGCSDCHLKEKK